MRRNTAALVAGVLCALAFAGCQNDPFSLPSPPEGLTITAHAITFSYPSAWFRTQWDQSSSFTFMVSAVSNRPLEPPCTTYTNGWSCGPPVASMDSATLIVEWWQNAFPRWTLGDQPGIDTTVDGLPAKLQDPADMTRTCASIGADSAMAVVIARPNANSNYFEFDACFRGPGIDAEKSAALAILKSASFQL